MKIELDDGYNFGKGLFETIKVVNGNPLFLDLHLNRLNKSLKFFKIEKEITEQKILNYIKNERKKNYALKISVSDKNVILVKRNDPYIKLDKNEKVRLTISKVRRNSTSHMVYHKSFNYYDNIIEKSKAKEEGFDEVIFLNERDYIAEGAVSNIFFVNKNKLYTPNASCGLLKGTMREFILNNYNVAEDYLKLEDLDKFEACFICNSLMGVLEVESIDSFSFEENKLIKEIKKHLSKYGF